MCTVNASVLFTLLTHFTARIGFVPQTAWSHQVSYLKICLMLHLYSLYISLDYSPRSLDLGSLSVFSRSLDLSKLPDISGFQRSSRTPILSGSQELYQT